MAFAEIHVVPLRDGAWSVCGHPRGEPWSLHPEATQALRAAMDLARDLAAERVVLHDRYGRTRTAPPPPARRAPRPARTRVV